MNTMDDRPKWQCQKCGSHERYKDGKCRPCMLAYAAEYRAKNKDAIAEKGLAYREANREQARQRTAAWRAAKTTEELRALEGKRNKQKRLADSKARYAKNAEAMRKKKAEWRAANPDRQLEIHRAYRRNNIDVCRERERNKRAMRRAAPGKLSAGIEHKLFGIQKGLCACCKKPLGDDYHLDHIVPLAIGGSNTDDNVQLLRRRCNQEKGKKHPVDFMQSRGYLL